MSKSVDSIGVMIERYESKANPESRFYFRATFTFGHWDRKGADILIQDFDTLEEMLAAYSVERRRRTKTERATSGTYTLELTGPGLDEWRADQACAAYGFRSRCREDINRKMKI